MNISQTDRLRQLVEAAKTRRANEEAALRDQELQNIQPWAVRYYSQEVADILRWTPLWDAQGLTAYLAFSVAGVDGQQRRFHLSPADSGLRQGMDRFRGHIGLLVSEDDPKEETFVDGKDSLLLELGRLLAL
jgi:hypothetical protein